MNDHDEMTPGGLDELEQVERRLRGALDAQARGSVPDRRLPPPMDWPKERSGRPAWLTPLAVAASVLLIAGGATVVATHRASEAPPATQTGPATTAPTTPATSSPTGPSTASATTSAATGATTTVSQGGTSTTVGGATLVVPAGWSIRQDTGSGRSTPINDTWCVEPGGGTTCPITFVRMDPASNQLNADIEGGLEANPEYCDPATGPDTRTLQDYSEVTWGGRAAEQRYWTHVCADGSTYEIEQYSVMTPTAYLLFSEKATPEVRAVMAGIRASAMLPAATSTTRLYDHGVLRSAKPAPGGAMTITVDRTVVGRPNSNPATYTYVVPSSVANTAGLSPAVGTLIVVHTDGHVVTSFVLPGG
ncbi:MAG: hypothetical protein ABI083_17230 [Lapillicoccus sp.]